MKNPVVDELKDLIKQATEERSHYYVKSVAEKAIAAIQKLEAQLWVARDSQLRTYDGLATKADNYDDLKVHTDQLVDAIEKYGKCVVMGSREDIIHAGQEMRDVLSAYYKFKETL